VNLEIKIVRVSDLIDVIRLKLSLIEKKIRFPNYPCCWK